MCGIAGVYGNFALWKAMMLTLGQLERGTEGAGLAWIQGNIQGNRIRIRKEPVHPIRFAQKNYRLFSERCKYAISHNRMPSVGKVCYYNTHPFMSCDRYFALAHNGTAFNGKLRKELLRKGHRIMGETDSELLAHRLEEYLHDRGNMIDALADLVENDLSGCVIVLTKEPRIYAARKGYLSVHYAKHGGEVYIASSSRAIEAILGDKAEVHELGSGQILEVDRGNIKVHGEPIEESTAKTHSCGYVSPWAYPRYYGRSLVGAWLDEEWGNLY